MPRPVVIDPKAVIRAYKSRKTMKQIADSHGVSKEIIRRLMWRHCPEVVLRRKKLDVRAITTFLTLEREREIVNDYKAGYNLSEIENRRRTSRDTVTKIVRHFIPNAVIPLGRPPRPIKSQPSHLTPKKAFLIGHLVGDGSICKRTKTISYCNKNHILVNVVAETIEEVFGIRAKISQHRNLFYAVCHSKRAYEDLIKYTQYGSRSWTVPNEILSNPLTLGRPFLRALADDEGSVSFHLQSSGKWLRRVSISSLCSSGRLGLLQLLSRLGIHARETINAVVINREENIARFARLIGFTSSVKILRGKWWRGHDKAEVLRLLLQSYKKGFSAHGS